MVSLEFASYRRVIARSPATPVIPGIYAKNVVIWVIGGRTWGKPGRFVLQKWLFFSGVQQLFFIRKAITSGRFSC